MRFLRIRHISSLGKLKTRTVAVDAELAAGLELDLFGEELCPGLVTFGEVLDPAASVSRGGELHNRDAASVTIALSTRPGSSRTGAGLGSLGKLPPWHGPQGKRNASLKFEICKMTALCNQPLDLFSHTGRVAFNVAIHVFLFSLDPGGLPRRAGPFNALTPANWRRPTTRNVPCGTMHQVVTIRPSHGGIQHTTCILPGPNFSRSSLSTEHTKYPPLGYSNPMRFMLDGAG